MYKNYMYESVFAELLHEYIAARREAGFQYNNPAYHLYRFDQHCKKLEIREPVITKELYDKWSFRFDKESKTSQNNRLQALRGFSSYLNTMGIESYIPVTLPKPEKIVPYLMSDDDIREFFEQVDRYETAPPRAAFYRMSVEYKVLFRLIYCCGLRNNEACTLKTENVDLANGCMILYHTKGNKDRVVYLSDDLRILCQNYQSWMRKELGGRQSEWFFPGKYPEYHITKTTVDRKFNEFWYATKASKVCDKKPTVHCLRHAFVIKRINLWMERDISLQVMMPYLSNYLGHKGPMETYYYYHQVEDVFQTVRRKDTVSARVIPEVAYEE